MNNVFSRYCFFSTVVLSFFIFCLSLTTQAQLCSGTLGAPIFRETFGSGTNPGPPLPAGTTTYTYAPGAISDGEYTISNISSPAPADPHWCSNSDHTGDPNGYMLVVNASYAPGEFFRRLVTGLCANTTYVFSGWISNVNNSTVSPYCGATYVYPNVIFKVENASGNTMQSVTTNNIPYSGANLNWRQYGFTFATGPGQTSVYLVMVNNGPGGCGNDLVIDDISFSPCGPTTSVTAFPSKQLYCSGENILLNATIGNGYNNPVYQWQFSNNGGTTWTDIAGATSEDFLLNQATISQAGQYRLLVAESGNIHLSKCRIITDVLTVNIVQSPVVTATPVPAFICSGKSSTLSANGATGYSWNNGSTGAAIHVSPSSTSTYTVTGTNTISGCTGQASVTVTVSTTPVSPVVTAPASICSGQAATLTATAPGGTYLWYDVSAGGIPVHTGSGYTTPLLSADKTYFVEVLTAAGCTSALRTPVTIKVNSTPVSPVVTAPASICSGNAATLTAMGPGGTYTWYDIPAGGIPIHTGNSYTTSLLQGDKTYYVTVTTAAGCSSVSRTPVTIKVNSTPVSPVVTAPASICSGNAVTLTATAPGGTYAWYDVPSGGSPLHTGTNYISPVLNVSKTYYVGVLSAAGCSSVVRTPVSITVHTTPVSPAVAAPDTICENTEVTLAVLAPGGNYNWYDLPSGGTLLHTGPVYKTVPADKKTYYVETISAAGCTSATRTPVTIWVAHVKAHFTASPLTGLAPLKVDFSNLSTGAGSYHWDFGDGTYGKNANDSHLYSAKGQGAVVKVKLTAIHPFGCTDTATIDIIISPFSKLTVPNVFTPNNDGINDVFKIESIGLSVIRAQLFNRWGLKLYEWDALYEGWDGRTLAGVEAPHGTYYYLISARGVDGKDYEFRGHFTLLR